jgi:predicted Fe-Mo cluster-binding NifX family protein
MNTGNAGETNIQYVAIPTDGADSLAHFGRAHTIAVFGIHGSEAVSRQDRLNPDPEHLDPAHHRVMLDLVRDCEVVLTAHIGPPMVASLTRLGIKVMGAPTESVEGALGAYLRSLTGGPPLEVLTFDPATAVTRQHEDHGLIQP